VKVRHHFSDIAYDEFHAVPRNMYLRMRWIDDTLSIYGYFNRVHLVRTFGVTMQTATNTIAEYQRITAGALTLVPRMRVYVRKGASIFDWATAEVLARDSANTEASSGDSRVTDEIEGDDQ
jgi:hypothetical protein